MLLLGLVDLRCCLLHRDIVAQQLIFEDNIEGSFKIIAVAY